MSEVTRHYDTLLAQHYSWMVGVPFDAKVAEQQALLEQLGAGRRSGLAVDLGSGPGYQSIALAKLGFSAVLAVDSSQPLLDELVSQSGGLPVKTACVDMRELRHLVAPGSASAIVCMGDTLTHLEKREDVSRLLADSHELLAPNGVLVLTFRDLTVELKGLERFLTVRSDADRIMTCMLEYETHSVVVNDLIYTREGPGWTLHKSSYRKLRLSPGEIAAELRQLGFTVQSNAPAGRLHAVAATR